MKLTKAKIDKMAAASKLNQKTSTAERRLYPYQLALAEYMQEMEQGTSSNMEMCFKGPRCSVLARSEAIEKALSSERNIVRTRYQGGFLTAPTGTGKTSIIIELLARNRPPLPNKHVRHSCLGSVTLQHRLLPIDLVVVPFKLAQQWEREVDILRQRSNWMFITSSQILNLFVDLIKDGARLPHHVLITDSMYKKLLDVRFEWSQPQPNLVRLNGKRGSDTERPAKRFKNEDGSSGGSSSSDSESSSAKEQEAAEQEEKDEMEEDYGDEEGRDAEQFDYRTFAFMFRVQRLVIDESESLNFKMLWADFIWFVSATFESFIKKCVLGGACKSVHSLLGELKQAIQLYTVAQLKELFLVSVCKSVYLSELPAESLPPPLASAIVYEAKPPTKFTKYHNFEALSARVWADLKGRLFNYIDSTKPGSVVVVFYAAKNAELENQMLVDLHNKMEADEEAGRESEYLLVSNAKTLTSKRIQQAIQSRSGGRRESESRLVLFMNARFVAEGLNLQMADYAVIINFMIQRMILQLIGRVQRPTRYSQLEIVRFWAPDSRLRHAAFKGRFESQYAEQKKLMSTEWSLATELAVAKQYEADERLMHGAIRQLEQQAAMLANSKQSPII